MMYDNVMDDPDDDDDDDDDGEGDDGDDCIPKLACSIHHLCLKWGINKLY